MASPSHRNAQTCCHGSCTHDRQNNLHLVTHAYYRATNSKSLRVPLPFNARCTPVPLVILRILVFSCSSFALASALRRLQCSGRQIGLHPSARMVVSKKTMRENGNSIHQMMVQVRDWSITSSVRFAFCGLNTLLQLAKLTLDDGGAGLGHLQVALGSLAQQSVCCAPGQPRCHRSHTRCLLGPWQREKPERYRLRPGCYPSRA